MASIAKITVYDLSVEVWEKSFRINGMYNTIPRKYPLDNVNYNDVRELVHSIRKAVAPAIKKELAAEIGEKLVGMLR